MPTDVLLAMVAGGAGWRLFGDLCASLIRAAVSLAHHLLPHRPGPPHDPIGTGFWRTHTALQTPERHP